MVLNNEVLNYCYCYVNRNLPLGLAPGVGLSAYLTYGLVLGDGLSVKEAFTTV